MEEYIELHIDPEPEHLRVLSHDANRQLLYTRMMSGHLQGRLLTMLTRMINPNRVLELGSYAGYSTLCIAEALSGHAVVDAVELDDELEPFLQNHFAASPYGNRISLHIGDALDVVKRLYAEGCRWNMAYIDADKRQYPEYYELLMQIMEPGSWILADNTLWGGKVAEASKNGTMPKDAQLAGILKFNKMVACDKRVEKVILPLRDGITIINILK